MRQFAWVTTWAHRAHEAEWSLPRRQTSRSAGYDFFVLETIEIPPQATVLLPTGVKMYLPEGEWLQLVLRSSAGRRGLRLANVIGVIDADYVDNPENEGHIQAMIYNFGAETQHLQAGDRLVQGVILPLLLTDDDDPVTSSREGGFGSTSSR